VLFRSLTWSDITAFTLEAADKDMFNSSENVFSFAQEQKLISKNTKIDDYVNFKLLSSFFMKAFNLKGGLMYTITKAPHFAYRELVYKEIIQGRSDPDMKVNGDNFLFILGRVLSFVEDDQNKEM
jgi:hypothetical protein